MVDNDVTVIRVGAMSCLHSSGCDWSDQTNQKVLVDLVPVLSEALLPCQVKASRHSRLLVDLRDGWVTRTGVCRTILRSELA